MRRVSSACLLLLAAARHLVMAQPASESRFVTIDAFGNKTPEQALAEALQSPEGRPAEEDPEGHWSPVLEGFQLSLRFSKQEYVIGEPVTAILLKRNTLYEPVEWRGSSSAAEGFSFLIVNEQLRALPSLAEPIIGGSSRSQRLEARTQRRFILDLAKEYDLSRPGTYSVSASHHVFSREKGISVPQQSGTALIRLVVPETNLVISAATNSGLISFSLELDRTTFTPGAPIPARMVISNSSINPVQYRRTGWKNWGTEIGDFIVIEEGSGRNGVSPADSHVSIPPQFPNLFLRVVPTPFVSHFPPARGRSRRPFPVRCRERRTPHP